MRILAAATLAVLISACSTYERYGLRPGASSEADVRRSMGVPAAEYANPDGSRQLAYTTGPMGMETFMVYVNRNGALDSIEQVLNDSQFFRIQTGMTGEEVRRLIGPPYRVVRFDRQRQDAWDYRYLDSWGYICDFSVMVDDRGLVASKVSVRLYVGKDGGFSR